MTRQALPSVMVFQQNTYVYPPTPPAPGPNVAVTTATIGAIALVLAAGVSGHYGVEAQRVAKKPEHDPHHHKHHKHGCSCKECCEKNAQRYGNGWLAINLRQSPWPREEPKRETEDRFTYLSHKSVKAIYPKLDMTGGFWIPGVYAKKRAARD